MPLSEALRGSRWSHPLAAPHAVAASAHSPSYTHDPAENDDIPRSVAVDDIDVLIHSVGCPRIPEVLRHPLACRQYVETLVALGPKEIPAPLQVPDEAVCLVLSRNSNSPNARV